MFKIIYIPASIKLKKKNLGNYLKCFFYSLFIIINNLNFSRKAKNNTSGYIDSSIHTNATVVELPYLLCMFLSKFIDFFFDGVFINWKFTSYRDDPNLEKKLIRFSKKFKIKKVIIDIRDRSDETINENIIKKYDFVIKREKNIAITNKKFLTTMLPCTLLKYKYSKKNYKIDWSTIGNSKPNNKFLYDVYFSGNNTSKNRIKIIKFLEKKKLNIRLDLKKINYNDYINNIYNSSINLALPGRGEFTFRHLEILCSCSFLLCNKEINQIELPIPLKDGIHFVSYENEADLEEKINFFLKNKELRDEISINGRKLIEKYYSPKLHGQNILNKIFEKKNT